MKIVYTQHLKFRMKMRGIPDNLPEKIFKEAKEHYYDNLTKHYVAIHKTRISNKLRELAVTYDKNMDVIEIITIHPLKTYQKTTRILQGRWRRI